MYFQVPNENVSSMIQKGAFKKGSTLFGPKVSTLSFQVPKEQVSSMIQKGALKSHGPQSDHLVFPV